MGTKLTDKKNIHAIIESGELDLGWCKIVKTRVKGGRGKSYSSSFERKPFYKLGIRMSKQTKEMLNK